MLSRHFLSTLKPLFVASFSFFLISCLEDKGNHMSQFLYPNSSNNPYYLGFQPVYADQPVDSIFFATTEQWKLKFEYSDNPGNWLQVDNSLLAPDFKIQENSIYYMGGPVTFTPNTTGNKRHVLITVDAGEYDCTGGFVQLPYLCITRPLRFVLTTADDSPLTSRDSIASLIALANTETDSVSFRVHNQWTLTVKPNSWITPRTTSGPAGTHSVILDYQPNLTSQPRLDTLFLTSGAVKDTIPVLQRGNS